MLRSTPIHEPIYLDPQDYQSPYPPHGIHLSSPRRQPREIPSLTPHSFILKRPFRPYPHDHPRQRMPPWEHMAQTHAWVLEQQFAEMMQKNEETVQWVLQQQERDVLRHQASSMAGAERAVRDLMEFVDSFFVEVDGCQRFEETWRTAMRWQQDAEKVVQQELRRLRRARLEAERCRIAFERRRTEDEAKERRRREKERETTKAARDEAGRKAWRAYESRWAAQVSSTTAGGPSSQEPLTFSSIPWPMFERPRKADDITPARVSGFILSPVHSEGQSRKDRIRAALRRWHPDRFGRLLPRVSERDRGAVEEAVGTIVRCLNSLLEREDENKQ